MTKDAAQQHYKTHRYDFEIQFNDGRIFEVYCTTETAKVIGDGFLESAAMVPVHPEFLGWTPEEIAQNAE
jgi:hypothetical protein